MSGFLTEPRPLEPPEMDERAGGVQGPYPPDNKRPQPEERSFPGVIDMTKKQQIKAALDRGDIVTANTLAIAGPAGTGTNDREVLRLHRFVVGLEVLIKEAKRALDKYAQDPKRFAPQKKSMENSLIQSLTMLRSALRTIGKL